MNRFPHRLTIALHLISELFVAVALLLSCLRSVSVADEPRSRALIGYTEYRTNLPGGRQVNLSTMRAYVVRVDGSDRRLLADELTHGTNAWTQFAGWSSDGKTAIIGRGWESPENSRWEEKHKRFRFTSEGWLYDTYLLDMQSGKRTNITAVERVSFYNTGLFFWPGDSTKLGFQALINGVSHPFVMDRDGRHKRDLTANSKGFSYGFSSSPDGKRIAYHKNYQIYVSDSNGSNVIHIKTGQPFNFYPQWSPDGKWLLFVSGKHYNCHPHVVRWDGSGLRKIADRNGYRGVIEFLDVSDFHGGSSDVPVWSGDGRSVYYTARHGENVELMAVSMEGQVTQLTHSPAGSLNYQPQPSPDGRWILFGSKRKGRRNLRIMRSDSKKERAVTDVAEGWGAMWAYWQLGAKAGRTN